MLGRVKGKSSTNKKLWQSQDGTVTKVSEMHEMHLINSYNYSLRAIAYFKAKGNIKEAKRWVPWRDIFKQELDNREVDV